MESHTAAWGDGFHGDEVERGTPFRWMGAQAVISFPPEDGARYLEIAAKCHFDDLSQGLTAGTEGGTPERFALSQGWNRVSVELPPGAHEATLTTNRLLPAEQHPGDGRDLGIQIQPALVHADRARHAEVRTKHEVRIRQARRLLDSPLSPFLRTARSLRFEAGFYQPEIDESQPFRWMARQARLGLPPAAGQRFLELSVRSQYRDGSQSLSLATEAGTHRFDLVEGWNNLSIPVEAGAAAVTLTASKRLPSQRRKGDPRELAVQVRAPLLHEEAGRHAHVQRQHLNRVANLREMLAGAVKLESMPPKLGIDIAGTCNVKPPCVYCEWDIAKDREGDNVDVPFNAFTLREYGPFFDNAVELVNCSIGEPFMVKSIDALLDAFGAQGKLLALTTNGQILTDVNIQKLLGRSVDLYISLDAATPETYARLRNDTLPRILDNIRRLVEAKGGPGNPPLVYLVFMPMRVNVHEVDAFVDLCARLQVDRLVLRPLNPSPGVELEWDRGGYHYDYQKELLPFEELVRISGRVAGLCARAGLVLSDQLDFGGEMRGHFQAAYDQGLREAAAAPMPGLEAGPKGAFDDPLSAGPVTRQAPRHEPAPAESPAVSSGPPASSPPETEPEGEESLGGENLPVCTEPWTSLYVLRRGTLPCCYGGGSIAPMADFKQAWNAPLVQEIRSELAAGRFHRYCFDSPDCPIVRKADEAHELPAAQYLLHRTRRAVNWLHRSSRGPIGHAYRLSLHYARLAAGRVRRILRRG